MNSKLTFALSLAMVGWVAGCSLPSSYPLVPRNQTNQVRRIEYGTVQKTEVVTISGRNSSIGVVGGGLTGAAAGSGVGHGVGTNLAQAGGAVVGAVAGEAVEEAATRKSGQSITVKLEDGSTVVVTQVSPPDFNVGDRVALLNGPGGAQVTWP
jgi:outer membrane lipoprotein SlyB